VMTGLGAQRAGKCSGTGSAQGRFQRPPDEGKMFND
jgi:hypothetical protein